ncbi:hypothetical protein BBJ28_00007716 [Nothophytophthora sp. Chile5]|nr:hypothetical protein BBJ28_00007716 [Nothophytophthora sp. Chile5]
MADGSSSSMDDGAQAQPQRQSLPLTADVVMDRAGVYDLLAMKELVLRDEELTELEPSCAQSLASLEILSLSHNRLSSLENFQHFGNLIEVSLAFRFCS